MSESGYAWIIDRDHLSGPGAEYDDGKGGDEGITGPRDAPISETALPFLNLCKQELAAHFKAHNQFRMYDDDGILYYTGTLYHDGEADEEACYGPLGDFGMPNAGAVLIKYTDHPEMDCG